MLRYLKGYVCSPLEELGGSFHSNTFNNYFFTILSIRFWLILSTEIIIVTIHLDNNKN